MLCPNGVNLLGCRFNIVTDQQSLKNLTEQTIHTLGQQKWLNKLVCVWFWDLPPRKIESSHWCPISNHHDDSSYFLQPQFLNCHRHLRRKSLPPRTPKTSIFNLILMPYKDTITKMVFFCFAVVWHFQQILHYALIYFMNFIPRPLVAMPVSHEPFTICIPIFSWKVCDGMSNSLSRTVKPINKWKIPFFHQSTCFNRFQSLN